MCLSKLTRSLYQTAWKGAIPLLRRHKRLSAHFEERFAKGNWPFDQDDALTTTTDIQKRPLLWVQAASGGEARLAEKFLKELQESLKELFPEAQGPLLNVLCTSWTEQGLGILKNINEEASCPLFEIISRYFPLDTEECMQRAITQAKPEAIVLLEAELWPNMLRIAAESNIPVFIINGRMTEKSYSGYKLLFKLPWLRKNNEKVFTIAPEDKSRFIKIFGSSNVELMRNIKFDAAWESLENKEKKASSSVSALFPTNVPIVLFASVRQKEEQRLVFAVKELDNFSVQGVHGVTVIAPRHMHRIETWKKLLKEQHIDFSLRSELQKNNDQQPNVILWDTFGELLDLYKLADAAFVGGSIAPLGGQNFLEPLGVGLAPIIGPHWENFRWAAPNGVLPPFVTEVGTTPEELVCALQDKLLENLSDAPESWSDARSKTRKKVKKEFTKWLSAHTGGSRQAAGVIKDALAESIRRTLS